MKEVQDTCQCNIVHTDTIQIVKDKMPAQGTLYGVAELFKVFGDLTRTKIISALFISELCVCDIADLLDMTRSAVSHQLRVLRQTRVVKMRKEGKEVYYSLDDQHIYKIYQMAVEHLEHLER